MWRRLGALAVAISAIGVGPVVADAASGCAVAWGSLAKVDQHLSGDGRAGGYGVRYVARMTGLASGRPVPLRGGAFLEVVVRVPAYDLNGRVTFARAGRSKLVNVTGYRTFRQVAWAESQEGLTAVGLGVRARLPFRVFALAGPGTGSRIVVDVAHSW